MIDPAKLLRQLHASLGALVEMDRLKSRAIAHEAVLVGAEGADARVLHVTLAILSGREEAAKKAIGEALFLTLQEALPSEMRTQVSLTVEVRTMERESYFRNEASGRRV